MIDVEYLKYLQSVRGEAKHRKGTEAFSRQEGELNILGHLIAVEESREQEYIRD